MQTIKCLLIVPNAESALNEEAGKLLLEHYNDYFTRAKFMTSIHASNESEYKRLLLSLGEHIGSMVSSPEKKSVPEGDQGFETTVIGTLT